MRRVGVSDGPISSGVCETRHQQYVDQLYKQRISSARAVVDTSPPKQHPHCFDRKKEQQTRKERNDAIYRDNLLLVNKMRNLENSTTHSLNNHHQQPYHRFSPSLIVNAKTKQLTEILVENEKFLGRLLNASAVYKKDDFDKMKQKHKVLLTKLCKFDYQEPSTTIPDNKFYLIQYQKMLQQQQQQQINNDNACNRYIHHIQQHHQPNQLEYDTKTNTWNNHPHTSHSNSNHHNHNNNVTLNPSNYPTSSSSHRSPSHSTDRSSIYTIVPRPNTSDTNTNTNNTNDPTPTLNNSASVLQQKYSTHTARVPKAQSVNKTHHRIHEALPLGSAVLPPKSAKNRSLTLPFPVISPQHRANTAAARYNHQPLSHQSPKHPSALTWAQFASPLPSDNNISLPPIPSTAPSSQTNNNTSTSSSSISTLYYDDYMYISSIHTYVRIYERTQPWRFDIEAYDYTAQLAYILSITLEQLREVLQSSQLYLLDGSQRPQLIQKLISVLSFIPSPSYAIDGTLQLCVDLVQTPMNNNNNPDQSSNDINNDPNTTTNQPPDSTTSELSHSSDHHHSTTTSPSTHHHNDDLHIIRDTLYQQQYQLLLEKQQLQILQLQHEQRLQLYQLRYPLPQHNNQHDNNNHNNNHDNNNNPTNPTDSSSSASTVDAASIQIQIDDLHSQHQSQLEQQLHLHALQQQQLYDMHYGNQDNNTNNSNNNEDSNHTQSNHTNFPVESSPDPLSAPQENSTSSSSSSSSSSTATTSSSSSSEAASSSPAHVPANTAVTSSSPSLVSASSPSSSDPVQSSHDNNNIISSYSTTAITTTTESHPNPTLTSSSSISSALSQNNPATTTHPDTLTHSYSSPIDPIDTNHTVTNNINDNQPTPIFN